MPKEKGFKKIIPRIYKYNAENIGLFFAVKAQLQIFPTMTLQQGIANYRKLLGISIDEWDDMCMINTYIRMQKEYYEDQRNGNPETNKGSACKEAGTDK